MSVVVTGSAVDLKYSYLPVSLDRDRLCVVLVATRNPLNLGAAARAMSNFGFRQLRVVNPYEVAFREARSAMGAARLLAEAKEFATVADAVADCTLVVGTTAVGHRELQHPLHSLETGARLIRARLRQSRVALLFGSEKFGLSNQDLSHCHWLLHIQTREAHPTMNLGQSVAVCLYELVRGRSATKAQTKDKSATSAEIERLTVLFFEALDSSGYVKPRAASLTEEKLRRMLRRLKVSQPDALVLQGMLRQILWKLRSLGK